MKTGVSTTLCGRVMRQARALVVEHSARIFRERAGDRYTMSSLDSVICADALGMRMS